MIHNRNSASFFILQPVIRDGDRLQLHPSNINRMAYAPYTHLEATPDFATFQFISPTLPEPTTRQVRFNSHQGGRIYHVEFRNKTRDRKDDPSWPDSKDFLCTVLTVLQIIEIYSERYPGRILRFSGDTPAKARVFGAIPGRFYHLLAPLFNVESDVEVETPGPSSAFLIKRKPIPCFSISTLESTWNGTSQIFRDRFSIKVDSRVRMQLVFNG
jgi:hypothetical protein